MSSKSTQVAGLDRSSGKALACVVAFPKFGDLPIELRYIIYFLRIKAKIPVISRVSQESRSVFLRNYCLIRPMNETDHTLVLFRAMLIDFLPESKQVGPASDRLQQLVFMGEFRHGSAGTHDDLIKFGALKKLVLPCQTYRSGVKLSYGRRKRLEKDITRRLLEGYLGVEEGGKLPDLDVQFKNNTEILVDIQN
ncbi:uncharacterized protein LY89DRAFT_665718 [Mollisia scopiformis]|uniref:Uncharacterized protein n=1 Tax=Mollisia scopiformis TaxID=149040 RepID=A0A194XM74_MOLSC|nr:uncharacterized protein LY89DRAFT_665718 [Mollisia scopiformis]KUJ21278.1 hypothetical protein LY89DRAFT_665718 [Mollisia scopiformis]